MTTNQSIKAKIGIKAIEAMQPHSILWDATVPGFQRKTAVFKRSDVLSRLPHIGGNPAMAALGALRRMDAGTSAKGSSESAARP